MKKINEEKTLMYRGVEFPDYKVDKEGNVTKLGNSVSQNIVSGRYYVTLNNGKQNTVQVAEALLETFAGRADNEEHRIVGFLDGNTNNINLDNLFWTNMKQWWLHPSVEISIPLTVSIQKEIEEEPEITNREIGFNLNLPAGLVRYVRENITTVQEEDGVIGGIGLANQEEITPQRKDMVANSMELATSMSSPRKLGEEEIMVKLPLSNLETGMLNYPSIFPESDEMNIIDDDPTVFASVEESYHYIISTELPAFRYAKVSGKKILNFILYKYGSEVYEYFRENYRVE